MFLRYYYLLTTHYSDIYKCIAGMHVCFCSNILYCIVLYSSTTICFSQWRHSLLKLFNVRVLQLRWQTVAGVRCVDGSDTVSGGTDWKLHNTKHWQSAVRNGRRLPVSPRPLRPPQHTSTVRLSVHRVSWVQGLELHRHPGLCAWVTSTSAKSRAGFVPCPALDLQQTSDHLCG